MNLSENTPNFNPNAMSTLTGGPLTMSSREIAELLEKRHDDVKRSIKRLADRGTIGQPPMADHLYTDAQGKERTTSVYNLEKRDTYVVVAQLSPEFTARLVDRWQELEAQTQPAMLTGPQLMAAALIEAQSTLKDQAQQIEAMQDDVETLGRLEQAEGSLNITEAAKGLGVRPKDLFSWLSQNGWVYKRNGAGAWLGYSSKCVSGLLEHKTTTIHRADGSEKVTEQVRVTAKGMVRLARLIPGAAKEVE